MRDAYDDFYSRQAKEERELAKLPICNNCGYHVQDEHFYLINDEVICPECLDNCFKKYTDNYAN